MKPRNKAVPPFMILGLGNPGPEYEESRHNVGFLFLEELSGELGASFKKTWFRPWLEAFAVLESLPLHLVKPLTYMNRSGIVLPSVMKKYGIPVERLIVVVDNMDLPTGKLRMKDKGSSAGHNGLKSIMAELGCSDFKRLYLGIDRPAKQDGVIDHVLGSFSGDEKVLLGQSLKKACHLFRTQLPQGWENLRNAVNQA